MKRRRILLAAIIIVLLLSTSCVPGNGRATEEEPARFLMGIWHGWIAPISLIASIFRSELAVYESFNSGFWYDLGFYMAIVGGFGSLNLARGTAKRRRKRERDEN